MIKSDINKVVIGDAVLYHADCMDVLPMLDKVGAIITDPTWPDAGLELNGSDDPYGIFASAGNHFPRLAKRAVIHLGCDSNPRFLSGIPSEMPFLRTCWLEYACPHYKGRILWTSDIAYVFGEPPSSIPGRRLMPGKCIATKVSEHWGHPCPRKDEHVEWLVHWFTDATDIILDPFMGSGTCGVAALKLGRKFIGCEIEKRYFDIAVERIKKEHDQLKMF